MCSTDIARAQLIPTPTWSSSIGPMLKSNSPPMPTHHEPFCSLSHVSRHRTRHSSLTGGANGTAALSVPTASISSPQGGPRFSHPQLPLPLLFLHLFLHQCHPIRPTPRVHGQHYRRGGERAHQERLLTATTGTACYPPSSYSLGLATGRRLRQYQDRGRLELRRFSHHRGRIGAYTQEEAQQQQQQQQ